MVENNHKQEFHTNDLSMADMPVNETDAEKTILVPINLARLIRERASSLFTHPSLHNQHEIPQHRSLWRFLIIFLCTRVCV